MKVSATLKGNKDAQGRRKVWIRINDRGKRKFIRTQIWVAKSDWNGLVKSSHPNHAILNIQIKKKIIEVESGLLSEEPKFSPINFYKYYIKCGGEWERTRAPGTHKQHRSEINKLKRFAPTLSLSGVTVDFLNAYKKELFITSSENTVWKSFKFLRLITRKAFREQLIKFNPFDIFEMPKYRDPEKIYLSRDQVNKIDKAKLPKELKLVATWFVIACYTGYRFQDQVNFSKSKIKAGRLIVYTQKTGEPVSMPLNDRLKTLFERIDYKPVPYHNVHYNRLLKEIALICGISENISAHTARHTFGVMCAESGISQEVTAKLMGHRRLTTTSIYYKITNPRIDEELRKIG